SSIPRQTIAADLFPIATLSARPIRPTSSSSISPVKEPTSSTRSPQKLPGRLAHRVPGANPLPFDLLDTPVKRGDRLIMISANQLQMTIPMQHHDITIRGSQSPYEIELNREPIAQACTAMEYYASTARASSVLYSDCNATVGASGSIVLT